MTTLRGPWRPAVTGLGRALTVRPVSGLLRAAFRDGPTPLALLVATDPDRTAWIDSEGSLTYAALAWEVAGRVAELGRLPAGNDPIDVPSGGPREVVLAVLAGMSARRTVRLRVATSGTTGEPHRVPSVGGIASLGQRLALLGRLPLPRHPVVASPAPVDRGHGLGTVLATLLLGGTYVRLDGAVDQRSVDLLTGVPVALRDVLGEGWLHHARVGVVLSGSDRLSQHVARELRDGFRAPVWDAYGATEVGTVTLAGPLDVAAGTVGRPLAGVRIRVLDDTGSPLPAGTEGILEVVSPAGLEPFVGDRGLLDGAGRVILRGRADGRVVSGGEVVDPERLRRWLLSLPGVVDATVTMRPDARFTHRLVASMVTTGALDAFAVRQRARRELGPAHTPVRIGITISEGSEPPDG